MRSPEAGAYRGLSASRGVVMGKPRTSRLTASRLRELLYYNRYTGIFTRLVTVAANAKVGDIAGCLDAKGYVVITIDYVPYLAHRLAWLYVYGVWPRSGLDHEDLCPSHNWLKNLREASKSQNGMNRRANKNNTTGYKGVSFKKGRGDFAAQITVSGKRKHLGYFETAELANEAYQAAEVSHYGSFRPQDTERGATI